MAKYRQAHGVEDFAAFLLSEQWPHLENDPALFHHALATSGAVSNVVRASQGEHGPDRPLSGGWSRRRAHRWPTGYCSNADTGTMSRRYKKSEEVDDRRVQPRFITSDLFSEKQVHERHLKWQYALRFSTRPQFGAVRSGS
jgi:hypothetical protein